MTTELYWLSLTALITALFWLPYVLDRLVVRGLWATITDTMPEGSGPQSLWARRAVRAHMNAVENLAIFAPLILTAHVLNISTPATQAAAMVYFCARLVHFIVYSAGIPMLRTLSFAVGWVSQMTILASILHWI